jgi:acyl transferase domain-containing protein/phosphopantetheinyl transferase
MRMSSSEAQGYSNEIAVRGDVAIIGMAGVFPGAPDLDTFWHNIVNKVDAITDVPPERWDPAIFFDPSSFANDRVYSKRGGYLSYPVQFNPADVGVIPITVIHGEPEQFLALMVAHQALADAGYLDRPTNRDRTQVIMGRGNYLNRGILTMMQHVRGAEDALRIIQRFRPELTEEELREIKAELKSNLPLFNSDTAPTLIPNLTTGRIANRLDLMGTNFTVDAACASSLVAAEIGVRDLLTQKCDLVLVGGIYVSTDVGFQSIFCQLHALSHRSQIRPFDKDADGLLLGEGAGCIVLKRLKDAEQDGDRIYAVIKGVGTASDGRALGVLAPRVEGEELALRRAYAMAGISPKTVQLIEAHGTATIAGDLAEVQAMTRVFGLRDGSLPWCGLGSIKSMIGHLMPAAGIAGLIKATLALYHKTLPPTLNYETPNPKLELEKSPFYVNTETRAWIRGLDETPRRAGVNAFGFGGINGHVILEEYRQTEEADLPSHLLHWETEVCIVQGNTRQALIAQMQRLQQYLAAAPQICLRDLAYTLNVELKHPYRVAIVASSVADLGKKLERALQRLSDPQRQQIKDREGIYFFAEPLSQEGKLAFLFPGVGAAYVNMLSDLCLHFPEVRSCFDLADQLFTPRKQASLLPSEIIYPPPNPSERERAQMQRRLWQEDGVLEAIHAADGALFALMKRLGVRPEMVVGHSFGDFFSLLLAASPDAPREVIIDAMVALEQSVYSTICTYERLRAEGQIPQNIALVNVGADSATVSNLFEAIDGRLYISMDNCPHQVVVVGEQGAVAQLTALLKGKGIFYDELPLEQPAYHTPMFEGARGLLEEHQWTPPTHLVEVYSCTTASPYPREPAGIRQLSVEHWMRRVEFRKTIEAMYEAGARIFVEVGPGGILTAFVDDILRGRPYLAVAANVARRSGITQLNHLVGMLASQRIPMSLEYLYKRRAPRRLSLDAAVDCATDEHDSPGMVDLALLGTPSLTLSPRAPAATGVQPDFPPRHAQRVAPPPPAQINGQSTTAQNLPSSEAIASRDIWQAPTSSPHVVAGITPPPNVPAAYALGNPPPPGVLANAMQGYLQTMDVFLETQAQVMHSLMAGARDSVPPNQQPVQLPDQPGQPMQMETPPRPFVGKIISIVPSQEVVTHRQIDLAEDLLLHDHTFGGQVSAVDETLEPLPVMPMTMGMELMAETAALLMPGKLLIEMKDIQTYQWIDLEEEQALLQTSARRRVGDPDEVEVRVHNLGKTGEDNGGKGALALQGVMVFADAYPDPPQLPPLALTSPRRPEFTAEEMYQEGLMFHGPRFQGVAALDAIAEEGVVGQLISLPLDNLFRSTAHPHLLIDFALLDAAGQLVGYWPLEWVATGYVMFPIRVDLVRMYGHMLPPGHTVLCQVQMRDVHQKFMRADIDIRRADGQLWMRLEGWCDWRFYCPDEAYDFSRFPGKIAASKSLPAAIAHFPSPEQFECCIAEHSEALYSKDAIAFWIKMWARLICSRQERREFYSLGGSEPQQIDRLLTRIAAKDAVRSLFHRQHGVSVPPADIEIVTDDNGRPEARGHWLPETGYIPTVSISHGAQLAVAIAGRCTSHQHLGIDVQQIESRPPEFEGIAFTPEERRVLGRIDASARLEWLARFWSAKEAVGKALGCGSPHGPQSVVVKAVDIDEEVIKVSLGDKLASEFPALAGVAMAVYTIRHRDLIIASTLCEGA